MEFISRKVFLTKYLVPYDSDNDGVVDSLVLSATTKTLQIPLKQSYDDIGIYEVSEDETFEIIEVSSVFNDSIQPNDVNQPNSGPSGVPTNTWDAGGESGFKSEVYYCDDKTATNGETLTYTIDEAILTSVGGTTTKYQKDSSGNFPTFKVDKTLCKYSQSVDFGTTSTSTDNTPEQTSNVSGMIKLYNWGSYTDNACNWTTTSSWSNFYSTAVSSAVSYCSNNGYPGGLLTSNDFKDADGNDITQGDCSTPPTQDANGNYSGYAFAGVKLDDSWTDYCVEGDNITTKYRYRYCFYCKK